MIYNIADLFEFVVDAVPDRPALVGGSARLTYGQLDRRANGFAHHLLTSGTAPGSFVGVLARNRVEWLEVMLGCFKARMVPVNLNFRYVAPELTYVIDNADLRALVFERDLAPLVAESLAGGGDRDLGLLVMGDGAGPAGQAGAVELGAQDYEAALSAASADRDFGPRSADDIYVLYTGGTTGMPKGVLWRQEDIFFAAMGGGGWGQDPITHPDQLAGRIDPDDASGVVMLVVAPLMHGNAQWVMWNAFMMGATAVLYTEHRYDPDRLWRIIGEEGVVSIGLVGAAMARPLAEALASAEPGTYDTSTLVVVG